MRNSSNQGVSELPGHVNLLSDKPVILAWNGSVGLRGSSNQLIIHLTPKLKGYDLESQTRKLEITITDGELGFIGIPTPEILSAMGSATYAGGERME